MVNEPRSFHYLIYNYRTKVTCHFASPSIACQGCEPFPGYRPLELLREMDSAVTLGYFPVSSQFLKALTNRIGVAMSQDTLAFQLSLPSIQAGSSLQQMAEFSLRARRDLDRLMDLLLRLAIPRQKPNLLLHRNIGRNNTLGLRCYGEGRVPFVDAL
ncbi:hypothetical protein NA56DRAFT_263871 [Hyaloscypha hepaticicola]|uniref:Uncharacterized protein n=1 Tax=Hyaloscypha hepaticicola TaxID=2082293 RepID=A0A2J6PUU9_9HELO|nr:hypothetical protein NA56DRAFT_263871 [Hyaloscypha hepaticicola]